ncbi:hypothetical protein F4677DRAFT_304191 [Hypoxylon crocopeplum]|nr:hypothetical protein F4677DRAFT_304191 [Hypoxylon crocopeplum]
MSCLSSLSARLLHLQFPLLGIRASTTSTVTSWELANPDGDFHRSNMTLRSRIRPRLASQLDGDSLLAPDALQRPARVWNLINLPGPHASLNRILIGTQVPGLSSLQESYALLLKCGMSYVDLSLSLKRC